MSADSNAIEALDPALRMVGRTLATRYRVGELLGRGGMGVVYGGTHIDLDRPVAIKVLPLSYTGDELTVRRFEQEARAASQVTHPNVVTIHDFGRLETGEPYLVMERLVGRDLDAVLAERGALPAREVIELLTPLADAIDAMHQRGIVHRDIKPSNIFVLPDSTPKLVDFGLATVAANRNRLTRSGTIVGTAEYLPPETAYGKMADKRGDIYSFAVVAYELLTGAVPFRGEPIEVLYAKVNSVPPALSSVGSSLFSTPIETLFLSALAVEPESRPKTASTFVRTLGEALTVDPPIPNGQLARRADPEKTHRATDELAPASSTVLKAPPARGGRAFVLGSAALGAAAAIVAVVIRPPGSAEGPTAVVHELLEPPVPRLEPPLPRRSSIPQGLDPSEAVLAPTVPNEVPSAETGTAPLGEAEPAAPDARQAGGSARHRRDARSSMTQGGRGAAASGIVTSESNTSGASAADASATSTSTPRSADPERARDLMNQGQAALLRGDIARAHRLYREATQASPRLASAWRSSAVTSERLGLRSEAVAAYQRYLRLAPTASDAAAVRERLEQLR